MVVDIEKAILAEKSCLRYLKTFFGDGNEPTPLVKRSEITIQALQEKAERDKGCEYCIGEECKNGFGRVFFTKIPHDTIDAVSPCEECFQLAFDDDGWAIYFEEDYGDRMFDVKISFCPMCGRKLEGSNHV